MKSLENQLNISDISTLFLLILFLVVLFMNSFIKLSKLDAILSSVKAKFQSLGQDTEAQLIPT